MKRQWQTLSFNDYSNGMDTRSSPDNIPTGFAEDLIDVDVKSTGEVETRKGQEGFAGNIPLQITKVQLEKIDGVNYHHFFLDNSFDFTNLKTRPLVVYGRLQNMYSSGDFSHPADAVYECEYYDRCFTSYTLRSPIVVGANTTTHLATETSIASTETWVSNCSASSTDINNLSWESIIPDTSKITASTYTLQSTLTALTAGELYTYWKDCSSDYVSGALTVANGTSTVTITAATHGRATSYLQTKFQKIDGSDYFDIIPNSVTIKANGDVEAVFVNPDVAFTVRAFVTNAVEANTTDFILTAGAQSISIPVTSPWVFCSIYKDSSGDFEEILPDVLAYNNLTGELDIDMTVDAGTYFFYFQYGTSSVNTISVVAENQVDGDYEETDPTLTLWGIDHSNYLSSSSGGKVSFLDSYETDSISELVTGLGGNLFYSGDRSTDYKIPIVNTALDDGIKAPLTVGPAITSGDYSRTRYSITADEVADNLIPISSVSYSNRVCTYSTGVLTNLDILNSSGVSQTVNFTNLALALSTKLGEEDWLTVSNMNNSSLNGTFKIINFSTDGSSISFDVINPNITCTDYDHTGAEAFAGVFTDKIVVNGYNWKAGDVINNTGYSYTLLNTTAYDWTAAAGGDESSSVILYPVTAAKSFSGGSRFSVTRTSTTLVPRDKVAVASGSLLNEWVVQNDVVTIGSNPNLFSVESVNSYTEDVIPNAVLTSDATGLKLEARDAVTMFRNVGIGDTIHLSNSEDENFTGNYVFDSVAAYDTTSTEIYSVYLEGSSSLVFKEAVFDLTEDTVTVTAHGLVTGEAVHFISDDAAPVTLYAASYTTARYYISVSDADTFQIHTTRDAALQGTSAVDISGSNLGTYYVAQQKFVRVTFGSITLRESVTVTEVNGGTSIDVGLRWISVEQPSLTSPKTHYFDANDYDEQDHMSGSMMNDNLYLTNGSDEVFKYDGVNLHRAGVFRWQSGVSISTDYSSATILHSSSATTVNSDPNGLSYFPVTSGNELDYVVGDIVWYIDTNTVADNAKYIVDKLESGKVFVTRVITATAAGTYSITRMDRRKYYMRLSGFDSNGNIIASAATGANDFVVDTYASHSNIISMLGFPDFGEYDFERIELSLYRTKEQSETFYKVATRQIHNASEGRVFVTDQLLDENLTQRDEVSIIQEGGNLGNGWDQPLRAKYCATVDSKLILANVKDYQELDMVIRKTDSGTLTAATLDETLLTFRKDNTLTGTATDLDNILVTEFVDEGNAGQNIAINSIVEGAVPGITLFTSGAAHGLSIGDWVWMYQDTYIASIKNTFSGLHRILTVPAANTFTIGYEEHGLTGAIPTATNVNAFAIATATVDVPVFLGTDYCCQQNLYNASGIVNLSVGRLTQAINTAMRATNATVAPWLTANSDSNYDLGQVVIRCPKDISTTIEVELGTATTEHEWFINGTARAHGTSAGSTIKLFPSRILASYTNYPELFDRPFVQSDTKSRSVIDVNPSDGQEITGIAPLFGDSVYGTGQKEGLLVVFKDRNIYIVNINDGTYTKIESEGLGCEAPYSIESAKNGVVFSNSSGIYRINKNLTVQYIGKNMQGAWNNDTNKNQLSTQVGHQSPINHKFMLSICRDSDTENDDVYVYEYSKETEGQLGAWSRYRNFNVTEWAGYTGKDYFGTHSGNVYRLRDHDSRVDYADDGDPISSEIILAANHFGKPNERKLVSHAFTSFDATYTMDDTVISMSTDLSTTFTATTPVSVETGSNQINMFKSSSPERKAVLYQLKVTNSAIYEPVKLTGVGYAVSLLNIHGIKEAVDS